MPRDGQLNVSLLAGSWAATLRATDGSVAETYTFEVTAAGRRVLE